MRTSRRPTLLRFNPPAIFTFSVVAVAVVLVLAAAPSAAADEVRVVARGAEIRGSNGIAVGPDGNLYVASVSGREIVVMDRRSGRVLERLGAEVGVETPDDVAFGPDGSLYWTALFAGQVGRLAPDGTASIVAQLPPGPNPIAFNAEGRLFVGLAAFGDGLYEIDPAGVEPPRRVLAPPTGGLNGFAFGPDGDLYSPQTTTGSVIRIDVDAGTVSPFATGFVLPVAVDFDSRGRLYVNDTAADQIVRIDPATGHREVFAELSDGVDNLAFDAADALYVTSLIQGSVRRVDQTGRVRTLSPGGFTFPGGLAVLPNGPPGQPDELWVADFFSLRAVSGTSGRELARLDTVPGISPLTAPRTVATDGDHLILSSWILNAVQVLDPASGQVLLHVPDFAVPLNAVRFQGDLVVAELATGSVVRASAADPSQRTTLANGFAVPTGLAATADDLFLADAALGSVFQLADGGTTLSPPRVLATALSGPEGLAVLPDGDLLVVEAAAGRLTRLDPVTGATTPVAEDLALGAPSLPGLPPSWFFNGVAAGTDGSAYVSGNVDTVLYRVRLD